MTSGVSVEVDYSEVTRLFRAVAARMGNDAALQIGVNVVSQSVLLNFMQGGRPQAWSLPKHRIGQPLRDKGILMASISGQVTGGRGLVSTVDKRAKALHYGINKVFATTVRASYQDSGREHA